MALHFRLMVNHDIVGQVYIQRTEKLDGRSTAYTYRVGVDYRGEHRSTEVTHYYQDGALVLVRKALQAIEELG